MTIAPAPQWGIAIALLGGLVLLASSPTTRAQPLEFEGQVEALQQGQLSSRLNGAITEILFRGGERVEVGEPLIALDAAELELAAAMAEAEVARAAAQLSLADQEADRARQLSARGIATDVRLETAEAALGTAEAEMTMAEVALERARLDLERSVIRSPIAGFVSRPMVAVGAFVEAEAGPPLATIVQLEPVLIAYQVPYAVRLASMEQSGAATLDELFGRITLQLVLPDGEVYPHGSAPDFASATVDPDTGALTIWAPFDNPDAILRPGMRLTVLSTIRGIGQ